MCRSSTVSALSILTLLIASEVSSAPAEERIPQESNQEKLTETREAEVMKHDLGRNENFKEFEDIEMLDRPLKLAQEPLSHKNESNVVSTTKPIDQQVELSVIKNLTATDNNKKKPAEVEASENKNSTVNAINFTDNLPPNVFPKDGVRNISNATEEECRKLTHYKTDESADSTANKSSTNNCSVEFIEITSTTNGSIVPTMVSNTTISTSTLLMSSSTTTSTTQPPIPRIITSIPNTTMEPVVTTEKVTNSEVVTDSTMTIASTVPSKAELKLHTKKIYPMPSGVIALITAIAFAIVSVMAYVGLVAWRRYHEWRYGNRELLVNDFDSNDIGNFEL